MTERIVKLTQAARVLHSVFARTRPRLVARAAGRKLERDIARVNSWWSPNIAGFGIGPKESRKRGSQAMVVRFYVYNKVHKSRVPRAHLIPGKVPFDHLEIEARTDIRQLQGVPQLNLAPGEEVGHFSGEQGTVGLFVKCDGDDGIFLLSCAHVLKPPGAGDHDAIESPVDNDSSRAINQVGAVEDSFPLRPGNGNLCDAAIARMQPEVELSNEIPDLGTPTSLLTDQEDLTGLGVSQRGFTTARTVSGTVREMSVSISFAFRGRIFGLSNLVRYDIESQRGDSGAAVVDGDMRVVGLHMGSEGGSTSAYFSPMHLMTDRFHITL
jgi:hypothetical protein